jgi:hypothetical protein
MAVQEQLPSDYANIITKHFPDYNSQEGKNLIYNVRSLKTADEKLTKIFEELAKRYNQLFHQTPIQIADDKDGSKN